jgi:hypothetical protein
MARFFEDTALLTFDPKLRDELNLLTSFIPVRLAWQSVSNRWGAVYVDVKEKVSRQLDCAVCRSVFIDCARETSEVLQHVKADARAGRLRLTKEMVGPLWCMAMLMQSSWGSRGPEVMRHEPSPRPASLLST